jgi:DNA-binding beta-propeller fold protein YncE
MFNKIFSDGIDEISGAFNYANGIGSSAQFSDPFGVAVNSAGNTIYVADTSNLRIRKMTR